MKVIWMALSGLLLSGLPLAAFFYPGVSLAGMNKQDNQERIKVPMQLPALSPSRKIPPVDTAIPAKTETATFALG